MLFIEKRLFILRMGEEVFGFYFIGLGEVLTSCLHTLLKDQTPCSSLSKNVFCEFRLILILKMILKKRKRP